MKIIRNILLIFFSVCWFNNPASAQTIQFSANPIDNSTYDFVKIIGSDEQGFYLLQSNISFETDKDRMGFKTRKYKLSYFTNNFKLKFEQTFSKGDDISPEAFEYVNGKVIIASTSFKKGNESKLLIQCSVLDNTGKIMPENFVIGEIDFTSSSELDKLKIFKSANQQHICFVQNEIKTGNTQTTHCLFTDANLKAITQKKIEIAYNEKNFYFEKWLLTNRGDFILLASYTSKENSSIKKKWTAYKLFVALRASVSFKEYALNSDDTFLGGANLAADNLNSKIVIAAFYNDRAPGTSGLIYASLNLLSESAPHVIKQPVEPSSRAKLMSSHSSTSSSPLQMLNLNIEKLILRNDGGAVIIAQLFYYSEYSYYDYFSQTYLRKIEYHYENVPVFSVNANGTTDWDVVLRKDQVSIDDDGVYSSFCFLSDEESLRLIYNPDIEMPGPLSVYSVTNKGVAEEKIISKPEDRLLIIPGAARQVSENEIIVPCWQKKNLMLAKIIF